MSKYIKWLGVGLGFTLGGPIGAILGFVLGSAVDQNILSNSQNKRIEPNRNGDRNKERRKERVHATPEDFEVSLLILASVVIKADGKVDESELNYVRAHFVKIYGKEKANDVFKLFNGIVKRKISTRQVSMQIREHMSHASRLQLIHFLFGIAKADGNVTPSEEEEIHKIANYFNINGSDYSSIKAMFYNEMDSAYKILEINKQASNDEVKKAYRKMAKKYHPDRVQNIGDEHNKGAKEKFQEIQNAYEKVKETRGFS